MAASVSLCSVRSWLDSSLFPDAPPSPRATPRRALIFVGVGAASVAIQLARMWRSKPLDSIFGEDGYIWLPDAMRHGFVHNVTTPYNGYLQTVSRLIAELVARLPVNWFAASMALSGALVVTGCAFVVWWASAAHIRSGLLRRALAATVVLLPIVGTESLDNVTNSIWFLLFASFWVLLWRPATLRGAVVGAAVLFLAALSDAGVALFLPVWTLRLIAVRDRRDSVMVAAFGVGLGMQLALSWKVMNLLGEQSPGQVQVSFPSEWHWNLVSAYIQRVVGGAATGQRITGLLWEHLGIPFEVILVASLAGLVALALGGRNARTRSLVAIMVATSMATFFVAGYKRWYSAGHRFLWPKGSSWTDAAHYMIVPTLILLSALFVQLDVQPGALSAIAWNRIRTVGVAFVLVAALFSFNVSDSSRGTTTWLQAVNTSRTECLRKNLDTARVLIAANGYFPVYMQAPCSKLAGSRSKH